MNEVIRRIGKRGLCLIFETNCAIWHTRILNNTQIQVESDAPLSFHFTDFDETHRWIKLQNSPWMLNEKEKQVAVNEKHYWANIQYNGVIIGYIKVGFNNVYINDYKKMIKFPQNTAYIYDTFVLPEFRKRKIATNFINETCKFLEKKGFQKVLCHIPEWNVASLKAYSNAGFVKSKTIRCFRIVGFPILTFNPTDL